MTSAPPEAITIQLTRRGANITKDESTLSRLRAEFERNNYVILPRLIERELFESLVRKVEAAPFISRVHEGIGVESCMTDRPTTNAFSFLASDPMFLRAVERISGCPRLGEFTGRVYRMTSSDGHYDTWHTDAIERRMVTMSLNLSRAPYGGGALQLKHRDSKKILGEVRNTGFGDALLFRISENLLHRVQGVEGTVAKTAFAGWFIEGADRLSASG